LLDVGVIELWVWRDRKRALEQLTMKWWHDRWQEDGLFTNLAWFSLLGIWVGAIVGPSVVAAVVVSLIVPVELWFAVVAVLMGWSIQWQLFPVVDRAPMTFGAAIAWITGAFTAAALLGPVAALVLLALAWQIVLWAIGKGEARKEAATVARLVADLGTPQERFEDGRTRMRVRMVGLWHVDEAEVDRLLDDWDAEAAVRGLGRFDRQYWNAGSQWLRAKVGVSDDVW
jgi:hypothetical protein